MTINERIKYFRKDLVNMSQTDFAVKLGMKQTSVSTFEKPGATVTDPTIKALCLAFSLNEDWLRNGVEPMYVQSPKFSLDEFVKKNKATELELDIIKAYFELDSGLRKILVEHFKNKLTDQPLDPHLIANKDIPDTPEELEKRFPPLEPKEIDVG